MESGSFSCPGQAKRKVPASREEGPIVASASKWLGEQERRSRAESADHPHQGLGLFARPFGPRPLVTHEVLRLGRKTSAWPLTAANSAGGSSLRAQTADHRSPGLGPFEISRSHGRQWSAEAAEGWALTI